ncbi:MAG: hypothetical protein JNM56_03615 [Planctomycetia bacterium]|nr:hypothetical protein [Planctomycetia bacterium]
MHRYRSLGMLLTLPALAVLMGGCGGGDNKGGPAPVATSPGTTTPPPSGERTAVEGKGVATLKGKITYDGEAPKPADITAQIQGQDDKAHCLKDDPKNPHPGSGRTWVVKDGNVANVVVWVSAPKGKFFKFSAEEKASWPKEVAVDQPFCHFEPHVSVSFPEFYNAETKKTSPTDQKIAVKNSAPISHNTKWAGSPQKNRGGNQTLQAGGEMALPLKADPTTPINIACDIHKWMTGYIWALDTPYAAVTNEDGTFEIKGIPAGADVQLILWHEQPGFFGEGGALGKKVKLNEGDNEMNFKVKAK